jgi:hypothetical protein
MSDLQLLMPAVHIKQIVIVCDGCDAEEAGDFLVADTDEAPTRHEYARAHARRLGWACDGWGDFCLACTQRREDT